MTFLYETISQDRPQNNIIIDQLSEKRVTLAIYITLKEIISSNTHTRTHAHTIYMMQHIPWDRNLSLMLAPYDAANAVHPKFITNTEVLEDYKRRSTQYNTICTSKYLKKTVWTKEEQPLQLHKLDLKLSKQEKANTKKQNTQTFTRTSDQHPTNWTNRHSDYLPSFTGWQFYCFHILLTCTSLPTHAFWFNCNKKNSPAIHFGIISYCKICKKFLWMQMFLLTFFNYVLI